MTDADKLMKLTEKFDKKYATAASELSDGQFSERGFKALAEAALLQKQMIECTEGEEREYHERRVMSLIQSIEYWNKAKHRTVPKASVPSASAPPTAKAAERKPTEKKKSTSTAAAKSSDSADEDKYIGNPSDWMFQGKLDVTFDDIVGLDSVKQVLKDMVIVSGEKNDYGYKPPVRILMYGPPGTGKTMLAKAFANYFMGEDGAFFSVTGSELISRYLGDSEKNITALFKEAAKYDKACIFLDEFDALCPPRTGGDNNNSEKRMVSAMLTITEGMKAVSNKTILIAATNLPWNIDSAMLTRFQSRVLIPVPDASARGTFVAKELSKLKLAPDVTIDYIVKNTANYNYRDLGNLCNKFAETLYHLDRQSGQFQMLTKEVVDGALKVVLPSVSKDEMERTKLWAKSI